MLPINNSDLAWLIVADYNQDNGKYHEELREDILNPLINQWECIDDSDSGEIVGDLAGGSEAGDNVCGLSMNYIVGSGFGVGKYVGGGGFGVSDSVLVGGNLYSRSTNIHNYR